MTTSAISSAVEASAFLTTSSVIGSTLVLGRRVSSIDVHLDVAERIEPRYAAGRHDARRVDLVDEQRAAALARE
jgi:hypothetical protein